MLPFCGYHMADYFAHWLEIGRREGAVLPRIFYVNWFRKDPSDGRWLWPGFGENARVLEWVFRRCDDAVEAQDTADRPRADRGRPEHGRALAQRARTWQSCCGSIPPSGCRRSARSASSTPSSASKLPGELQAQLDGLEERLQRARS